MRELKSFCRLCLNGCGLSVSVDGGRALRIRGDHENPVYAGFTCVKGRHQAELLRSPQRLLRPLKRRGDGGWDSISSAQALDEIATMLQGIIARHGPRAVAGYLGTFFAASVPMQPLFLGFMDAIGSPMRFSPGTIDKPGKKIAEALHGSWMAPAVGFDDPEAILLIGINPLITFTGFPYGNPGHWLGQRIESGAKLIVVDPRRTHVARRAHLHLQSKPGTDAALVAALLHVLLTEGCFDRDFVSAYASGLDELRRAVAPFTPRAVAEFCGVAADDVVRAARMLGGTRRGYVMAGTGPNMSGHGSLIEYLLLNLHTLCGYWLRAGDRVRHPGALAAALKPRAQVAPAKPAYGFGERLRVRGLTNTAAGMPTGALPDEMLLEGEGRVRALLSCAGNPAAAWPDQRKTVRALTSLELLVQIDPWMSATAQLAHYIIPPKLWLETPNTSQTLDWLTRYGTGYGQQDPYAQYTPAVVEPPPDSDLMEEWEFYYEVARRLNLPLSISPQLGPDMPPVPLDMACKPSTDELLEMLSRGARVPLSEVKRHPSGAVFADPPVFVAADAAHAAHRLQLAAPEMMRDLAEVASTLAPDANAATGQRSFRLLCRRMMHVYNSSFVGSLPRPGTPYNPAFLHTQSMNELGIVDGDLIEVESQRGCIVAVAQADDALLPGLVSMSFGFGALPDVPSDPLEVGANPALLLANDEIFDRYTGQPLMTNVPVSVRAVRAGSAQAG